jgi:hypothetical protein
MIYKCGEMDIRTFFSSGTLRPFNGPGRRPSRRSESTQMSIIYNYIMIEHMKIKLSSFLVLIATAAAIAPWAVEVEPEARAS